MKQKGWDTLIIGASHNGLAMSVYRVRPRLNVLILERRDVLGGTRVTEEIVPGFKVSTAAYLGSLKTLEIQRGVSR